MLKVFLKEMFDMRLGLIHGVKITVYSKNELNANVFSSKILCLRIYIKGTEIFINLKQRLLAFLEVLNPTISIHTFINRHSRVLANKARGDHNLQIS